MKREMVVMCLERAKEELEELVTLLRQEPAETSDSLLHARLPWIYRDLNLAWNRRDMDLERVNEVEDSLKERFYRFPTAMMSQFMEIEGLP